MPPGTLYVVATPLGNLGDLTIRAAETLRTVPVVAAEDTRRTRGLLVHLGARPRLLSFHAHSPDRRIEVLIEILRDGKDVALVSDAGTPTISDPGAGLVAAVRGAGFAVVPLPGATAVGAALSAAGLPADRYLFLGFIPRRGKERERLLRLAAESRWTVAFYEAPTRLVALLEDLRSVVGADRRVVVARELTKLHEEIRSESLTEAIGHYGGQPPRGELTILLEGTGEAPGEPADRELAMATATGLLASGMTRRAVVQHLVRTSGLPRNDAYRIVMDLP